MVNEEEVKKIAKLANLHLEEDRVAPLTKEFNSILNFIEQLKAVDTSNSEALSHVHGFTNIFREDKVEELLTTEEALANAPDRSGDFIRVPLVIDQGSDN